MSNTVTVPRGTHRVTRATMPDAVRALAPFQYNASAAGLWRTPTEVLDDAGAWGAWTEDDTAARAELAAHLDGRPTTEPDAAADVYVVYSYRTPVAVRRHDGTWWTWKNASTSTTRAHLGMVRRGLPYGDTLAD